MSQSFAAISTAAALKQAERPSTQRRPRLGFLGVGWIGRNRMEAIVATGMAEIAAIADPSQAMRDEALALAPGAQAAASLEDLLAQDLDGLVIASPSALHAAQSIAALKRGVAVFCQKPLGRSKAEVQAVLDAAREADRLIGVDLSYREVEAVKAVRALVRKGDLGRIFSIDLTFHNAYGPDKPWFYDKMLSGGGCVMDLGVHMVDMALWALDFPQIEAVEGQLFAGGRPIAAESAEVEDFALATIRIKDGPVIRLACSWKLQAGQDAVIEAKIYGTQGGAAFRNAGGSFYDFTADLFHGTRTERLIDPPDAWGGRMAARWAEQLATSNRFDPESEHLADVTDVLDRVYGRG
ncbi:oxidoreductase [Xaviernesmea oryzae]|uniref:Oxidoreductase n=1 Tax=Xaviernesmea oryzae TaxID=464029 RepID=A0A1Q9B244_9HYPH|nr:Gfo/Idh/MocA family oxidoreductase [Xaviernesmea oryzae]OLP62081.1 oxidoreductase [Xaviernesmea oryzae]SEL86797.1 Predicted dehydrogenase [Xaviernesmea oryzae]